MGAGDESLTVTSEEFARALSKSPIATCRYVSTVFPYDTTMSADVFLVGGWGFEMATCMGMPTVPVAGAVAAIPTG